MHMSPGLPIMKSKDLVNWQLVGYAYDTLGDDDALTLRNGKNAYGRGSWASSLRYHDGTFYVSTFSGTTGKTYVYRTKDPEKGPWQETSFRPALHDHSLFFDDDGRVYMVNGVGDIRLTELNAGPLGGQARRGGSGDRPQGQRRGRAARRPARGRLADAQDQRQVLPLQYHLAEGRHAHRSHSSGRQASTGPYEGRVVFARPGRRAGRPHRYARGRVVRLLFRTTARSAASRTSCR